MCNKCNPELCPAGLTQQECADDLCFCEGIKLVETNEPNQQTFDFYRQKIPEEING